MDRLPPLALAAQTGKTFLLHNKRVVKYNIISKSASFCTLFTQKKK